jgi:stage V sporulation protein S
MQPKDYSMTSTTENTAVELRVAARTPTVELASAISHAVYDSKAVVLRAIGAGAVNQAVKALAIAQGYVAQRGLSLVNRPGFITVTMDGEERTAIVFHVFTI